MCILHIQPLKVIINQAYQKIECFSTLVINAHLKFIIYSLAFKGQKYNKDWRIRSIGHIFNNCIESLNLNNYERCTTRR